ncbi:MAG: IclR family transcriptional regulator, partial [Comamonadaceae bacterium]
RRPAHCTALGKALLASLSDRQARSLLPPVLARLTPRTVTDVDAVIGSLQQVRRDGFARDAEEVSPGLHCFGAYVGVTRSGRRIAVSTSTSAQADATRSRALASAITQLARQIAVEVARS